ncbi:MAG: hypothetical protein ACC647_09370 [Anaerolineales bacterium]
MKSHRRPIITLLILAPVTGELLSGSAPPSEFFNPFTFLPLIALYGSGALLTRELARRWGKGWASILLLGMAYGIYEEGIVVRSFFDPTWMDLGLLAEYGRYLGVNWVWALELTLFHAVVSIMIPIMLVEMLFPAHRNSPWLNRSGLIVYSLLLLSMMAMGPLFGMQASLPALSGSVLAIGLLLLLAYSWPVSMRDDKGQRRAFPAGCFVFMGFAGAAGWLITIFVLPELSVPALVDLFLGAFWPLLITVLVWILSRRGWRDRQQWGLVAGILLLFIFLAFIAEADNATRPDNTAGMALVGLTFLGFMAGLGVKVWRRPPAVSKAAP